LNNKMETPSQWANTVFVSNISPTANEKTVSEFFSFCGKITEMKLVTYPNKGGEATVTFETEAAAKTALLLTNALIADRPITVVPYTSADDHHFQQTSSTPEAVRKELYGDQVPNKEHSVPAEQRTKTSVVASMLAAGYILGNDAILKARDIDEQNQISVKAAAAVEVVKAKAVEIDQKLRISENAAALGQRVRQLDEQYRVSDNLQAAYKTASDSVEAGVQKAKETPAVQSAVATISTLSESVNSYLAPKTEALRGSVTDIQQQTNQIIEERTRSRSQGKDDIPQPPPPPPPAEH